jgi:hypothetical protein
MTMRMDDPISDHQLCARKFRNEHSGSMNLGMTDPMNNLSTASTLFPMSVSGKGAGNMRKNQ